MSASIERVECDATLFQARRIGQQIYIVPATANWAGWMDRAAVRHHGVAVSAAVLDLAVIEARRGIVSSWEDVVLRYTDTSEWVCERMRARLDRAVAS